METLHRGESQIDALKRLIQEELDGLPGIEIESIPHGEYWIASARATLYVGHTRSSRLPALGKGMSDVGGHRWIRRRMRPWALARRGHGKCFLITSGVEPGLCATTAVRYRRPRQILVESL